MEAEQWREVEGYGGHYQVSSHGRVRRNGRLLKPSISGRGYERVRLSGGGLHCLRSVHRLVALAFIPGSGESVNHRDANKRNNHSENLEWMSKDENIRHAFDLGLCRVKARPVYGVDADGNGLFLRVGYLGRKFGFTPQSISAVARGERAKHKGWTWSYA